MCGEGGSLADPLIWSTWGLEFVSDPFPFHRDCADLYFAPAGA